jgi:hypothetical protein
VLVLGAVPASATPPGRDGELLGIWNGRLALMSTDAQWVGTTRMHLQIADMDVCPNGVHLMFDGESVTEYGPPVVAMYVSRWNGTKKHRLPYHGLSPMCLGHGRFDYVGFTRREVPVIRQGSWDGRPAHSLVALPGMAVGAPFKISPDHQWIAFPGDTESPVVSGIWLVHPDGTGLHRLPVPANTRVTGELDWAPDSSHLLFGVFTLDPSPDQVAYHYLVRPDGTGLQRIGRGIEGVFAPSGTRILHLTSYHWYEVLELADGNETPIPLPNGAAQANRPEFFAWEPITTHRRSTLSVRIVRQDHWTFTLSGTIAPVGEALQRIVVTKYQRRGGGAVDVERHLVVSRGRTFSTWMADDRPYNRETCTVRVHFLGDPVSLPATRTVRFDC